MSNLDPKKYRAAKAKKKPPSKSSLVDFREKTPLPHKKQESGDKHFDNAIDKLFGIKKDKK